MISKPTDEEKEGRRDDMINTSLVAVIILLLICMALIDYFHPWKGMVVVTKSSQGCDSFAPWGFYFFSL